MLMKKGKESIDLKLRCVYSKQCNHVKGELINMTRAWDKKIIWGPDRNQIHDLPNNGRALYPQSYENSWTERYTVRISTAEVIVSSEMSHELS